MVTHHLGFKILLSALAILLLSSCTKDDPVEPLSFYAETGSVVSTKTQLDDHKVNWISGDKISINGVTYTATPRSDATKADFAKSDSKSDPTSPFTAYYPSDIYDGTTATLPQTQYYHASDSIANCPMYASSTTTSLSFKNICAIIELQLTGFDLIKKIEVSSSDRNLWGNFTVDDKYVANISSGGSQTVTLDCGDGVRLNKSTATNFRIAIPAGSDTLTFKIVNTEGDTYAFTKKTKSKVSVEANKIYAISWTPTFTKGTALRAGNVSVPYLQLWYDGPKFAEYNVGASDKNEDGTLYASADTTSAVSSWGSNWKMLDDLDFVNLINNTDYSTEVFRGKTPYADNELWLPAAGYDSGGGVLGHGEIGDYWSSNSGHYFEFQKDGTNLKVVETDPGSIKMSLRLILNE